MGNPPTVICVRVIPLWIGPESESASTEDEDSHWGDVTVRILGYCAWLVAHAWVGMSNGKWTALPFSSDDCPFRRLFLRFNCTRSRATWQCDNGEGLMLLSIALVRKIRALWPSAYEPLHQVIDFSDCLASLSSHAFRTAWSKGRSWSYLRSPAMMCSRTGNMVGDGRYSIRALL